jgi:hypothetical protein
VFYPNNRISPGQSLTPVATGVHATIWLPIRGEDAYEAMFADPAEWI